jgi:hypothetical protein
MQASHMHHKFDDFHDQSSSASRVTAGAAGFLILSQQSFGLAGTARPKALRHHALAAERAGLFGDDRAVDFEVAVEGNAWSRAAAGPLHWIHGVQSGPFIFFQVLVILPSASHVFRDGQVKTRP